MILDSIPGNHLILLPDAPAFTIVGATDAYLEATYTTREQIIGKGVFEIFSDNSDNAERTGVFNLNASLHYVLEKKKPHHMDDQRYDVINPQTGVFEHKVWSPQNKPVPDKTGQVQYIIHTVEDITEKLRLEEESRVTGQKLGEIENRFRNMVEQAPVAILLTQGEEVVIEIVNAPMMEFMNRTSEKELLGKKMLEALPELEGQPALQTVVNVQKTGVPWKGDEVPVDLMKNGRTERHYFNFSYTPVVEAGIVTGVLHVAVDVTPQVEIRMKIEELVSRRTQELAQANEALLATNIELTRSNNNLEEFTHAVSHDLKEPIRKINFFTRQLRDLLTHQAQEAELALLNKIGNATQRMNNLIEDLLQFSHVSQRPHQKEQVDLNKTVQAVYHELELAIQEKKATLQTAQLPVVCGYAGQLEQLLQNLVSNALKYSRKEVPPCITISAGLVTEQGKPYHLIGVRDNGIGFEQQYEERIFQMFSRLHGKNEYSGTGVGLSIVKKVLENHGGFIHATSTPGEGSVFSIYLPAE